MPRSAEQPSHFPGCCTVCSAAANGGVCAQDRTGPALPGRAATPAALQTGRSPMMEVVSSCIRITHVAVAAWTWRLSRAEPSYLARLQIGRQPSKMQRICCAKTESTKTDSLFYNSLVLSKSSHRTGRSRQVCSVTASLSGATPLLS